MTTATDAILTADAHLNNAGLTTHTEVIAALSLLVYQIGNLLPANNAALAHARTVVDQAMPHLPIEGD